MIASSLKQTGVDFHRDLPNHFQTSWESCPHRPSGRISGFWNFPLSAPSIPGPGVISIFSLFVLLSDGTRGLREFPIPVRPAEGWNAVSGSRQLPPSACAPQLVLSVTQSPPLPKSMYNDGSKSTLSNSITSHQLLHIHCTFTTPQPVNVLLPRFRRAGPLQGARNAIGETHLVRPNIFILGPSHSYTCTHH